MWSGIPETQGNLERQSPHLTQSWEASFITPDITNFNSLCCDSIESASSATTHKEPIFNYVYGLLVVISVVHQISSFHFPRVGYCVLTPVMLGKVCACPKNCKWKGYLLYLQARTLTCWFKTVSPLRQLSSVWDGYCSTSLGPFQPIMDL